MPKNQNRGSRDFSRFDAMSSGELEEILRLDAKRPMGEESDTEMLLYVMGVLAGRRRNSDNPGKTAEEAFESFKENYLPMEYTEESEDDFQWEVSDKSRKPKPWLRRLTAAAAAIAIVLCCSLTASAFGFDIWEIVAKWTQETFHFGTGIQTDVSEPVLDDERDLSLQESLLMNNVTVQLAPTWIPDGYKLIELIFDDTPLQRTYLAVYQNGDKLLKVSIIDYLGTYPEQIERSETLSETYESNGITYYIFSDYDQLRVAWVNGNFECYISGELTMEEMKTMIDSIE